MNRDLRPIAVDLFSGVGGMSLGFEQAGFNVACAVESDRTHAGAHRFNFPKTDVVCEDAANVTSDDILLSVRRSIGARESARPEIAVVFGGPPCQGFSVGGHMDPNDPRNELVKRFVALVTELTPQGFVLENVPAMATRVLPGFDAPVPAWIGEVLGKAGYDVQVPRILNASRFGVPQDRRRLIITGVRKGEDAPAIPDALTLALPKRPGMTPRALEVGHAKAPVDLAVGPSVKDAIGDLPNLDDFPELLERDETRPSESTRLLSRAVRSPYAAILAGDVVDATDLSAPRAWDPSLLTSSLRTTHSDETRMRFESTPQGGVDSISRFYRLHEAGLCGTLRAGSAPDRGSFSAPRPIHPIYPRVISVREAARLHGFPDWFRLSAAKWHGFRQVGNAVPPPLARAVAIAMRDALGLPQIKLEEPLPAPENALLRVASGGGRIRGAGRLKPAPAG